MDKISIIIPTYKRSSFLKRAIESVLRQSYENIEVIIIDDNIENSDYRLETEKIMKEYEKNLKIKYFKNSENLGGALSRNKGIELATGKYICFLDDDDEYVFNKVEKQYYFFKEKVNDNKGFVYCQSIFIDENGMKIPNTKRLISGNKEALIQILKGGLTSTGCIFLSKELLIEIKGFEKIICGQEWYLILKILLKGYECYHMEDELLVYHEHSGERITNNNNKIKGEKFLYEVKKKHIQNLSEKKQKELNYINNINLVNLHLELKEKGWFFYLKEALSYKMISFKDLFKLIINIFLNQKQKIYLKRIVRY